MNPTLEQISVCVCTFRRTALLSRLLEALLIQRGAGDAFQLSIVIVDNDGERSAEEVASRVSGEGVVDLIYVCEPERNFAVVRNRAVEKAGGDLIAFIDDDEVPGPDWLKSLRGTMREYSCDGVLGPVRPYFDDPPPRWLEQSRLCERSEHPTGMMLNWSQTRTGNVLLKKSIFTENGLWFDPVYRTGGEDVDFFKRSMNAGKQFVWSTEAAVRELVPPDRLKLGYYLRRALLQGSISLKYRAGEQGVGARLLVASKCLLATGLYTASLPFLALASKGRCARVLVKNCHHLGRLSALVGCPIVREREMT